MPDDQDGRQRRTMPRWRVALLAAGAILVIVAPLAALILSGNDSSSEDGSTPTSGAPTTAVELFTDGEQVGLCDDLTTDGDEPLPGGSWVDVTEVLSGGRREVAFSTELRLSGLVPSDEWVVTEEQLVAARCEEGEVFPTPACRMGERATLRVLVLDGNGSEEVLEPGDWVWLSFMYDDDAYVTTLWGSEGRISDGLLECCPDFDRPALPQRGELGCLSEPVSTGSQPPG